MDEPRKWPNYLPNRNKDISIIFGSPLNPLVEPLLDTYRRAFPTPWRPSTYDRPVGEDLRDEPGELAGMRSEMAEVLRRGLMRLGETVGEVEKREPERLRWWS
jgi:monolysocardiolipin acyltransferase